MVTCNQCGSRFNSDLMNACMVCTSRAEAAEKARLEAEMNRYTEQERQEQREEERRKFVSTALGRIERALDEGRVPALHTTVFMNMDYIVGTDVGGLGPQPDQWASMAWDGWEVVTSFPHTAALPLVNQVSGQEAYAGGIGGIVDGVDLLMRFPISRELMEARGDYLQTLLSNQFERMHEERGLEPLPLGTSTLGIQNGISADSNGVGGAASLGVAAAGVAFGVRGVRSYLAQDEGENLSADSGGDFDGGDVDDGGGLLDMFDF